MNEVVPNKQPTLDPGPVNRLAVIGEAPGKDELVAGEPFVGASGRYLRAVLAQVGVSTNHVFFGNICQVNPTNNDIETLPWDGPEIQTGLTQLATDLSVFRPSGILLLGRSAFRAFRPDLCYPTKKGYVIPLSDWRGSITKTAPLDGALGSAVSNVRAVGTFHPAYILRARGDSPLFKFDVARAAAVASTPSIDADTLVPVGTQATLYPSVQEVITLYAEIRSQRLPITFDIEGFADNIGVTMYSVWCRALNRGLVVPFHLDGKRYWSLEDETIVWQETAQLLADANIAKTAHNAFYELFVFAWRHACIVNNVRHDTMMMQWECFPELERSLAVATSIHTRIPFYKYQRLSNATETKLVYNLTDSYATDKVETSAATILDKIPNSVAHYNFNINLIPAYNYLMLRGCRLDTIRTAELRTTAEKEVADLNAEISQKLGRDFNVKSVVDKKWLLYDHLKYAPYKRYGTSTTEDILLAYHAKHRDPIVRLVIRCVRKRTRLSDINKLVPNPDGRIRTSYDIVGTPTARLTSRSSIALYRTDDGDWDNTGTNLQNVTKDLRVCFTPDDPQRTFFQADLAGADGWTVAAELAALGQATMLEDYLAGVKPALVVFFMLQEHQAGRDAAKVNLLDRTELKARLREVKLHIDSLEGKHGPDGRPLDWMYLCCKRVQHGTNYGAAPKKIAEVIFGDSDGTIDLSEKDATLYQYFYKLRYKTDYRFEWIRRELRDKGYLVASCGVRRQFFSIYNRYDVEDSIVREAASFNPQANTTFCTNKALERLWYDPSNRTSTGTLHIEPLLQIHDALAGQFKLSAVDYARAKIPEWFNNPIMVGKVQVTIPADAKTGQNWKETTTPL